MPLRARLARTPLVPIFIFVVLGLFGCSYVPNVDDISIGSPDTPAARPTRAAFLDTPPPSTVDTTETILSGLVVAPIAETMPDYNRKDWRHWVDADGDCQNARQEVLIEESIEAVTFIDSEQCRVASGQWVAPFTGASVADPKKLDVDHMVPLANAHRSGAHSWTRERKREYANYLQEPSHLIAVTAGANRSKGSKGPEAWKPPDGGYWCQYGTDWARIKSHWQLTVTPDELVALRDLLATCQGGAP
jgi:hypothetical protein